MDDQRIFQGSYKTFPIFWEESTTEGGRSLVVRQFPNKDTQNVEDTGGIPRRFRIKLCVFATSGFTYFGYRNELLRVLDSQGSGVLIHPLYGRIEQVYSGKYEIREEQNSFGKSIINVLFEVSNNTGVPVATQNTFTNVEALNTIILDNLSSSFSDNFSVEVASPGSFSDAVSNGLQVSSAIENAIKYKTIGEGSFETIKSNLSDFNNTINEKVLSATNYANGMLGLLEDAYNVYSNPRTSLEVMSGLFGFGVSDVTLVLSTISKAKRIANRILTNDLINAGSLTYAYQAAATIEFDTVSEINTIRDLLEDQFFLVRGSSLDDEIKGNIEDIRVTANDILDNATLSARELISIHTSELPARVISFNYYGDEFSGEQIALTNGLFDVSYIKGDISILTA